MRRDALVGAATMPALLVIILLAYGLTVGLRDMFNQTGTNRRQTTLAGFDGDIIDEPRGPALFDMLRDHVGDVPYGGMGIFECANPGQVALTFDDGPWHYTEDVTAELDKYDFKATFFITGHNLWLERKVDDEDTEWPAMVRKMHKRGHQIASHTWTHQHLDEVNHTERVRELVYNEMALRNVLGFVPTYMRLPYGGPRSEEVIDDLEELGYHIIQWNVDTKDYKHDSAGDIQDSVTLFADEISKSGNGSYIVLCHDIREWTAKRLVPAMLEILVDRGYEAVTVGQCLDDPSEFWYRDPDRKVLSSGAGRIR